MAVGAVALKRMVGLRAGLSDAAGATAVNRHLLEIRRSGRKEKVRAQHLTRPRRLFRFFGEGLYPESEVFPKATGLAPLSSAVS